MSDRSNWSRRRCPLWTALPSMQHTHTNPAMSPNPFFCFVFAASHKNIHKHTKIHSQSLAHNHTLMHVSPNYPEHTDTHTGVTLCDVKAGLSLCRLQSITLCLPQFCLTGSTAHTTNQPSPIQRSGLGNVSPNSQQE